MNPYALLLLLGAGWGLTQPLMKIATGAGHGPLGLLFWQVVLIPLLLAPLALRGGRPERKGAALRFAAVVALLGVLVPNGASYVAVSVMPAGIVSILLALVPIVALPMAVVLGLEKARPLRLAGVALGAVGVLVLLAPGAVSFDAALIPLGLIAPLCYAGQANLIAKMGTFGLRPEQLMALASLIAVPLALPLALRSGFVDPFRPWDVGIWAFLLATAVHAAVYCAYVALLRREGPVFATQVTYVVTGAGVVWAMMLLGERYGIAAWAGLGLILCGIALVRRA